MQFDDLKQVARNITFHRIRGILTRQPVLRIAVWSLFAWISVCLLGHIVRLAAGWDNGPAHFLIEMFGAFVAVGLVYSLWVEYCVSGKRKILLAALAFSGLALGTALHGLTSLLPQNDYAYIRQPIWHFQVAWQIAAAILLIEATRNTVVDKREKTRKFGRLVIFLPLTLSFFFETIALRVYSHCPRLLDAVSSPPWMDSNLRGIFAPHTIADWLILAVYFAAFAMFARDYINGEDRLDEGMTNCLLMLATSQVIAVMGAGNYNTASWIGHLYALAALTVLLVRLGIEFSASYADAQSRVEHLEAVHYISSRLNKTLDLRIVLLTFVTDSAKMLSARFSSIMLADELGETLATIATYGLLEAPMRPSEPMRLSGIGGGFHAGHTARAFRERQICVVDDIYTDVEFVPWRLLANHDGYSVSVPLLHHDIVLGVLNMFFEEHVPLNDERIKLFQTLASAAAVAIANAQLYERSLQFEEMALEEDCLRESERLAS